MALFSITFLFMSLVHAYATNLCIDTKMNQGFSFLESVQLCQTTGDNHSKTIEPTIVFTTFPSQVLYHTKNVPSHILDFPPRTSAMPTLITAHPHMPYILAASCTLSLVTISSKSFHIAFYSLATGIL